MLYRTKAAAEILMGLTAKEAFELSEMVRHIQKRFYIGTRMIPFENIPKDDARDRIQCILNDGTLDIPIQMRGPLERFLEVMVEERAPMDMLVEEYDTALSQVFQPDLFKPEATQDGLPDRLEPTPGASTKRQYIPHPDAAGPKDRAEDKLEEKGDRWKELSDISDGIVKDLVGLGLALYEASYVIEDVQEILKASQEMYHRWADATPIKELKRMREAAEK